MTATDRTDRIATWWSPDGWYREPGPPHWAIEATLVIGFGDLRRHSGYYAIREYKPDGSWFLQPEVWAHPDQGLFVQLWSADSTIATYFVASKHEDAFMATEYPRLLEVGLRERQADSVEKIAKTLLAFVRHGQGRSTIDALGEVSRDDTEHYEHRSQQDRSVGKAGPRC